MMVMIMVMMVMIMVMVAVMPTMVIMVPMIAVMMMPMRLVMPVLLWLVLVVSPWGGFCTNNECEQDTTDKQNLSKHFKLLRGVKGDIQHVRLRYRNHSRVASDF